MYSVKVFNKISQKGLEYLNSLNFSSDENIDDPDIILLRSFKLHGYSFNSNLKAIGRAGAGVNNIPIEECTSKGIAVFNTPGANANAVKELVLASLFLTSRNIFQGLNFIKSLSINSVDDTHTEIENNKSKFKGTEISGKKIGIIGLGAIGVQVANDAIRLGLEVFGYDPYISIDRAWGLSSQVNQVENLNKMLSVVDFISFHVPLTKSTTGFFDNEKFSKLKPNVVLLNFARPEIINEIDLIDFLSKAKSSKFVTDFPNKALLSLDNVVGLPHLGASTIEAEDNCSDMITKQVSEFLLNGNITHSVNFPNCNLERTSKYRLTIFHSNIPNMIGKISQYLANDNINIVELMNKSKDDIAYTIIDIENMPNQNTLDSIESINGVNFVRVFK